MKNFLEFLGAVTVVGALLFGLLVGGVCGFRALGECGNRVGPGATESWIGACAEHKSLAECVHDAAIMGCR